MNLCVFEGQSVTPEMPGYCRTCSMYLNTCIPVINAGYCAGSECDMYYCECCQRYDECGLNSVK